MQSYQQTRKVTRVADLTIGELLSWLKGEAVYGTTHLEIAKGLKAATSATKEEAPTFFELTLDTHLQTAQMYAAKLHDNHPDAATVKTLVDKADRSAGSFASATPQEVRSMVEIARLMIDALKPHLDALEIRRNEYLAHLDPSTIRDLPSMNARATLRIDDLDFVLVETTNILNLFSQALDGTISAAMLKTSDDYKSLLK